MKKGTVTEIAKECGVSAMTVSRALRDNELVNKDTKKRIMEAAERMGYTRSSTRGRPAAVKSSEPQKVQLIVGLTGHRMAEFYSQLVITLERLVSRLGHECTIRTCSGDYQEFMQLLEKTRQSESIANIIIGNFPDNQLEALFKELPGAVLLDNPGGAHLRTRYISFAFDNSEAAVISTRHLLDCGRKKILLVGGTAEHFFTREIEFGYREALAANSIAVNEKLILHTDFSAQSACEAVGRTLEQGLEFDAVFTNDEMASGVYRALLQHNLSIPGDVAVCGCDGLPVGIHLLPKLTTVVLDYEELGKMAVNYIFDKSGNSSVPHKVRLLPRLEIRESTV